jgi:tetratricopeptide (TPR) repeat protein
LKKNLKKQIKQDELVTGFEQARAALESHADEVKIAGVIVLVLAVGGFALQHFRAQRDQDANAALAAALVKFRTPVSGETSAEPQEPGTQSFPTSLEKYTKTLTELQRIDQRYSSSPAGVRARYYGALCLIELGKNQEAEAILKQLATQRTGLEPALAKLALADLQRRNGNFDAAADAYRQIANDSTFIWPRDHALLSLAEVYEQARRPNEAQAAYRELLDKFPESTYATEARRRVEYLQPARG